MYVTVLPSSRGNNCVVCVVVSSNNVSRTTIVFCLVRYLRDVHPALATARSSWDLVHGGAESTGPREKEEGVCAYVSAMCAINSQHGFFTFIPPPLMETRRLTLIYP